MADNFGRQTRRKGCGRPGPGAPPFWGGFVYVRPLANFQYFWCNRNGFGGREPVSNRFCASVIIFVRWACFVSLSKIFSVGIGATRLTLSPFHLYSRLMNAELIERCRVMLVQGFSAYRVGKEVGVHPNTVKYWCVPGWKEEMIEGVRRWQEENPERVKVLNRVSARNRAEKVNSGNRAWRAANPEKAAESGRKWRKANWKQLRLKATHIRLVNDAVEMRDEWVYIRYLGMPVSQFVRVMCEEAVRRGLSGGWRDGWELDHYRPACAFDLEKEEDRWVCFHWSNFQPVTRSQNLRKGGREPEGPWLPIVEEDKAGLPDGFNLHRDGWRYVPSWLAEGFRKALSDDE